MTQRDVASRSRSELIALLVIAGPLAATQLSQLAMSLIASVSLGQINSAAFAAGGLCAIIIQTLTVVAQGLLAGVQPLLAADRGADHAGLGHQGMGTKGFAGAYLLALALAALMVLALHNLAPLLALFGIAPDVMAAAQAFAGPASWSLPAVLLVAPLRFHLAVESRTWVIMLAAGAGVPIYAGLMHYLVLGPPALGIAGAGMAYAGIWWAIALALSAYVGFARLLPKGLFALTAKEVLAGMRAVATLGWPIALIYAAELGLTSVLALMIGSFGTIALAAHQVTHSVNSLAFMPSLALGQAVTVRVAFHMGAGRPDLARRAGNLALKLAAGKMALLGILAVLFVKPLTAFFVGAGNPDLPAILTLTNTLMAILAIFLVCDGLQAVAAGALRGLKDTRIPMLVGVLSYWIIGFPVAAVGAFGLGLGPAGIWLGILAGIGTVALLLTYRWRRLTTLPVALPLATAA